MNEHNTQERKLKTDIHFKNELRRDLSASLAQLHSWQEKLVELKNTRKQKKLSSTVERYASYIHELKGFMAPLLDDLEGRIKAEMDFSEDEIADFRKEVSEESVQAADARKAFDRARELLESTEDNKKADPEELNAAREAYRKAFRAFRLERTELKQAQEELESELRDREIFKRELKRIMVERHFMSEV